MPDTARREVLWVSEEELENLKQEKPTLNGFPRYCSVTRHGLVKFWPPFDPQTQTIQMVERWPEK